MAHGTTGGTKAGDQLKGPAIDKVFRRPISTERRAELALDLVHEMRALEAEENAKRDTVKEFKERIEGLWASVRRLADDVESGKQDTVVKVVPMVEFETNRLAYVDEHGEVVEERALSAEEREAVAQGTFAFPGSDVSQEAPPPRQLKITMAEPVERKKPRGKEAAGA